MKDKFLEWLESELNRINDWYDDCEIAGCAEGMESALRDINKYEEVKQKYLAVHKESEESP